MRLVFILIFFRLSLNAQVPLWQLEYAPDSTKVIGAAADGEPIWVPKSAIATLDSIYMLNDTIRLRDGSGNVVLPKWYTGETLPSLGSPYKYGDIFVVTPVASCIYSYSLYRNIDTSWMQLFTIVGCAEPNYDNDPTNELADFYSQISAPTGIKKGDIWYNTETFVTKIYDGAEWDDMDNRDFYNINFFDANTYSVSLQHENVNSALIAIKGGSGINITEGLSSEAVLSVDSIWVGQIISDSLATITTEPDSIQRVGNTITLRDGDGSVDLSDLVNVPDSTTVVNSYGTIITESPSNTWNITVDSTKFATTFDLTLIPSPPDSTIIIDGWGITSVESPTNTYNLMADSSQVFTQYDGTLKQDKLPSFAAGSVIFSNGTTLAQDNTNLFWDDTNKALKVKSIPITSKATYQVSIGQDAGTNDSEYSTFIGLDAGRYATNADYSTFVGPLAGTGAAGSYQSNFFGLNAGNNAVNAYYSNFFGRDAGRNSTSSYSNYFGYLSGLGATGYGNNFFGVSAGTNNAGNFNNFFGYEAGTAVGGSDYSNHFGFRAGYKSQGDFNDFFGANAGYNTETGSFNYSAGLNSLYSNVSGSNNVAIGRNSGYSSLGSANVYIGYESGYNETGSNKLYIDNSSTSSPLIGGHFDNNRVGINTAIGSIASTLHVTGGTRITDLSGSGNRMVIANSDGDLSTQTIPSGTVTNVTASSPLSSSGGSTPNITLDTTSATGAATQYDLTLKQNLLTGANKRIPYFTGTNTLSNSDNLVFDNATKYLGIGTASPDATIHMTQATGNRIRFTDPSSGLNYKNWQIFAGSGADERNLSFQSLSDAGTEYNFMTWRKATNSQLISNLYIPHLATSSGTEVATVNTVGEIYRSELKTVGGTSLFGTGNIPTYTLPSFSSGSVIFSNGTDLAQDNANFFWNNSTKRLSLGTASASRQLTTTQDISVNGNDIGLGGANQPNNARFGNAALNNNTTGVGNLAIGAYTLLNNTTGYYNTGLGNQALFTNISGHTNTAIGQNTLYYNTGNQNTGIGTQSLFSNVGGNQNTAVSPFALYSNVSGSGNIAIGYGAGYSETGSNRLYIENSTSSSPLIGGHFDNRRVGINTSISDIGRTLDVNGEVRIRDLTTTNPTILVGSDANGVLSGVTLGAGLSYTGTTLNATGVTGSGTATRVAFWSGTSSLSSDSNLFWDNSNKYLGVGTASPSRLLHVAGDAQINRYFFGSDGQIVAGQDGSGYYYAAGGTSVAKPIYIGNSSTTFTRIATLAGVGSRMVTANGNGDLGTAALMSLTTTGVGSATYNSGTGVLNVPNTNLSYSIKSGTDVTLESSTGADVILKDGVGTVANRTASNVLKYDAVGAEICQLSNPNSTTFSNPPTTAGTYTVNLNNEDVNPSTSTFTVSLGNDDITTLIAGTYEFIFSGKGSNSGNGAIFFEKWTNATSSWGYFYGQDQGILTSTFSNVQFTDIITMAANDKVRVRYVLSTGQTISLNQVRLIAKRLR
jgi:hypothetical protein